MGRFKIEVTERKTESPRGATASQGGCSSDVTNSNGAAAPGAPHRSRRHPAKPEARGISPLSGR